MRSPKARAARSGAAGTRIALIVGMAALQRVRFHGRGGEGVKQASHIVARALFLSGLNVQDAPLYGAERRGAPVMAFVRFGEQPVRERGYIVDPDVIVICNDSLLHLADAAVLAGLDPGGLVLINSARSADDLRRAHGIAAAVLCRDVSAIALRHLGQHLLSAPMAAFALKASGRVSWGQVARAVEIELAEAGLAPAAIERNLAAARETFDSVGAVGFPAPRAQAAAGPLPVFVLPRLPARAAAPSIAAAATSALRTTEGWRVYRPVIHRQRCTRCFLCFALCPEGAIQLDAEHWPVVDYAHCKGCLVCASECPTGTIESVREDAAAEEVAR